MALQITRSFKFWPLVLAPFFLVGCDEDDVQSTVEQVRAIKYITLDDRAGAQERRIAGVVSASLTANVAFETGGQVVDLVFGAGDEVTQGDLVARLDPEPYRLQAEQAQSSLDQAQAALEDAQRKFDQTSRLKDQGFATQTAFDSAVATLKNAEGAVGVARSQLDLARRELSKTDLRAPFSGVISRKLVDQFEEVTGGTPIYAIQSDGDNKVEASLPETLINEISLGAEVEVSFPPLGNASTMGRIDEISPLTGDVNAYPIEVVLTGTVPGLRPGMSAEIVLSFASAETGVAFVAPMSAILPDPAGGEEAHVFVFDPGSETLSKHPIKVANVRGNDLLIVGDLDVGDIIAAAGISFLHDGMRVKLLAPDALR